MGKTSSFIPQGIHRIGSGGFDRLVAHRKKGDNQSGKRGQEKNLEMNPSPVSITLKPPADDKVSGRPGYQVGCQYPFCGSAEKQPHNAGSRSTENSSNPNLFGSLFGYKGSQSQESKTRKENRQKG